MSFCFEQMRDGDTSGRNCRDERNEIFPLKGVAIPFYKLRKKVN